METVLASTLETTEGATHTLTDYTLTLRFVARATPPTLADVEAEVINLTLREHGNNQRRAAKALGISRWSLGRKLKNLKLR